AVTKRTGARGPDHSQLEAGALGWLWAERASRRYGVMQASSRYTVMVATVTVFALAASMLGARKITEMSAAMQDAAGDGAAVIELSGCAFRPEILAVRPGEVVSFANTDSGSPNVLEFRT